MVRKTFSHLAVSMSLAVGCGIGCSTAMAQLGTLTPAAKAVFSAELRKLPHTQGRAGQPPIASAQPDHQPLVKKAASDAPAADGSNPPENGPRGGGNDECGFPFVLAGSPVSFLQDASNASTGNAGQNNPGCQAFGVRGIGNDEWFLWIANATGVATLTACGGGIIDTKAAVWDGTACSPSALLGCND
ncbi:MAG: hypothetical protein H7210_05620, partial [Pyrinomonadaceae bacterium]|nr:hypothetical protein [Phycisphaerales bacterium]